MTSANSRSPGFAGALDGKPDARDESLYNDQIIVAKGVL
jgi:hypothetical protein